MTLLVFSFSVLTVSAQDYNPNRYRESLFPDVLTIPDVLYGSSPQWIWPYWDEDLYLDVYVPDGDDNPKRPLIIFAHSGGFINGSKNVDDMVAICDSFARKGYVTASIAYRKGFDPLDSESAERAAYRGLQDGKAAVRYFKENASLYDIDTNYIFFGGMSAGGFISLNVAYMDKESERPESTYGGGLVNDLECLDCAGNDYPHSSEVRAILDFWGGVNDTLIIETGDIPMMIMHGEHDETVPFVFGHPFGLFTLPESYGGQPISERAENIDLYYEFFTSEGSNHMLDGSDNGTWDDDSPNSFWSDTLLPESTRFLWENMKPNTSLVSDEYVEVCAPYGIVELTVSPGDDSHFVWDFDEASISFVSGEFTNEVSLEFSEPGDYEIVITEFNEILCAGIPVTFYVHVELVAADFSYAFIEPNYVGFTNLTGDPSLTYTWTFGDGETSSEFEPNHVYESIGEYEVTLLAESEIGCQDTSISLVSVLALDLLPNSIAAVNMHPNPFSESFTISGNEQLVKMIVMDATGQLIYEVNLLNSISYTVETSTWANGLYFIQLQDLNGNIVTKRVVKH